MSCSACLSWVELPCTGPCAGFRITQSGFLAPTPWVTLARFLHLPKSPFPPLYREPQRQLLQGAENRR